MSDTLLGNFVCESYQVTLVNNFLTGVTPVKILHTGVTPVGNILTGVTPAENFLTGVTPVENFLTGVTPVENFLTGVTPVKNFLTGVTLVKNLEATGIVRQGVENENYFLKCRVHYNHGLLETRTGNSKTTVKNVKIDLPFFSPFPQKWMKLFTFFLKSRIILLVIMTKS